MFRNNYDVTNKAYLERIRKNYKIHKNAEQKEKKEYPNKKQEENKPVSDKTNQLKEKTDKGNNLDFYA